MNPTRNKFDKNNINNFYNINMVKYMEGTSSEDALEYHCNEMVKRRRK